MGEREALFDPRCNRREVIVGQWGHTLAHPSNCPDCNPNRIAADLRKAFHSTGGR